MRLQAISTEFPSARSIWQKWTTCPKQHGAGPNAAASVA